MKADLVPNENVNIFITIYKIENALREFIIRTLSDAYGASWFKSRLPGTVLAKYREGIKIERSIKWQRLVPHHPLYYIDFSHLKEILNRNDNWEQQFKSIFGQREIFMATLSQLELIRNKMAHNRKASPEDVATVQDSYVKLEAAIGPQQLRDFLLSPTLAEDIPSRLAALRHECQEVFRLINQIAPLTHPDVWESVRDEWWFDESYLSSGIDNIQAFYSKATDYASLPILRGTGHKIQKWVRTSGIEQYYANASLEFDQLLEKVNEVKAWTSRA